MKKAAPTRGGLLSFRAGAAGPKARRPRLGEVPGAARSSRGPCPRVSCARCLMDAGGPRRVWPRRTFSVQFLAPRRRHPRCPSCRRRS
jgi:hypothetical protein